MKKIYYLLILLSCTIQLFATEATKVIRNPYVSNPQSWLQIDSIELTSDTTIFYVTGKNLPGNWISINSQSMLEPIRGDQRYKLLKSEGFELDKKVAMPESGEVKFNLYFEPVDTTMHYSLIEEECLRQAAISGIHLIESDDINHVTVKERYNRFKQFEYASNKAIQLLPSLCTFFMLFICMIVILASRKGMQNNIFIILRLGMFFCGIGIGLLFGTNLFMKTDPLLTTIYNIPLSILLFNTLLLIAPGAMLLLSFIIELVLSRSLFYNSSTKV